MIILQKIIFKNLPSLKILNPIPLATVDNLAVKQKLLADRHFIRTKRKTGQQPTAGLSNAGFHSTSNHSAFNYLCAGGQESGFNSRTS